MSGILLPFSFSLLGFFFQTVPVLLSFLGHDPDLGHLLLLFLQVFVELGLILLECLVAQLARQPWDRAAIIFAPAVQEVMVSAFLDDHRLVYLSVEGGFCSPDDPDAKSDVF